MHVRTTAVVFVSTLIMMMSATGRSRAFDSEGPIPYPRGFREWTHVKSAIVVAGHPAFATEGGIHHIYANPIAFAGYRFGTFGDGAVIVYELLETRESANMVTEGARRHVKRRPPESTSIERDRGASSVHRSPPPRDARSVVIATVIDLTPVEPRLELMRPRCPRAQRDSSSYNLAHARTPC